MSGRRYFGTDGVRGEVGKDPMTADFALRLASAAAQVLVPRGGTVLIGKDTRLSGYMFESALEAGFVAAGADVLLLGPLPTPGIAYLNQEFKADLGVVISASHNRYYDNGIKFFDGAGAKLTDDVERQIEHYLDQPAITLESAKLGSAKRIDSARIRYQEFCASTFPEGRNLEGIKIVFDGANGAGYKVGPRILSDLGAEVIPIGCSPNGRNINDGCGSTEPALLQLTVPALRADVGIALDGDGDRVVMVDELGGILDGDQLLYVLALARKKAGKLRGPVVGTVMSNLGLEKYREEQGLELRRTQVGDRYVVEAMREHGYNLGGEQSGHLIFLDHASTGDGMNSALQVISIMARTGKKLSELVQGFRRFPQALLGIRVAERKPIESLPSVQRAIRKVEAELGDRGRVLIRYSGTELLARIMVEGENEDNVQAIAQHLADELARALAA